MKFSLFPFLLALLFRIFASDVDSEGLEFFSLSSSEESEEALEPLAPLTDEDKGDKDLIELFLWQPGEIFDLSKIILLSKLNGISDVEYIEYILLHSQMGLFLRTPQIPLGVEVPLGRLLQSGRLHALSPILSRLDYKTAITLVKNLGPKFQKNAAVIKEMVRFIVSASGSILDCDVTILHLLYLCNADAFLEVIDEPLIKERLMMLLLNDHLEDRAQKWEKHYPSMNLGCALDAESISESMPVLHKELRALPVLSLFWSVIAMIDKPIPPTLAIQTINSILTRDPLAKFHAISLCCQNILKAALLRRFLLELGLQDFATDVQAKLVSLQIGNN